MNQEQLSDQLQKLVNSSLEREKYIYNIVLGVSSGDTKFSWTGAAGVADPASDRPMQAETPFFIASVTKMYTAAAIMVLEERGSVALGDKISKYLPGDLIHGLHHFQGTDYTEALTIRHLISQTSGLPDYFLERPKNGKSVLDRILEEGDQAWGLEDVVRLTREAFPSKFKPAVLDGGKGVKAHYSDTNYKLLGAIVEAASGRPLQATFEQLFFGPLGLRNTYLYGQNNGTASVEPAAVFHKDRPLVVERLMASHGPEGGIVSTLDDTLRFGKAFMSGELFSRKETLETMQQWNKIFFPMQYGYGLMRFKVPRFLPSIGYSPELIGHSGSSGSFLFHCKELNLCMSGTINQLTLRTLPFRLMTKVAQMFKRASQ